MNNVALFGNPNTGKTSLFNMITGSYEYVGNWAGVTVEKKVGLLKNKEVQITDLPGVYSIIPLSSDETVATQFLLNETFSAIINIVDASQLVRNLYLTVQLLEYGKPMHIALNMVDVAQKRGIHIDPVRLSGLLGVSITPIVARTGKGCEAIANRCLENQAPGDQGMKPFMLDYGAELEAAIEVIAQKRKVSQVILTAGWQFNF